MHTQPDHRAGQRHLGAEGTGHRCPQSRGQCGGLQDEVLAQKSLLKDDRTSTEGAKHQINFKYYFWL